MNLRTSPYDWKHPITDPKLFAGRKKELQEIKGEVLKLLNSPPISPFIAVVGERRVGKTSLMNMISLMCKENRILSPRLRLETVMVNNPWEFWHAIFLTIQNEYNSGGGTNCQNYANKGQVHVLQNSANTGRDDIWGKIQFMGQYNRSAYTPAQPPSSIVIESDLRLLVNDLLGQGYFGFNLIIDEAQLLQSSDVVREQLRNIFQNGPSVGLTLVGLPNLIDLNSKTGEPFYGQLTIIPLVNYKMPDEVIECALSPIAEAEHKLMSPQTMEYLSRLSQGKPNQIRLICDAIYNRFIEGKQKDLNISVDILDKITDQLTQEYLNEDSENRNLRGQATAIQNLNGLDVEILYNLTKYPNWTIDEIVELDESFRGEASNKLSIERRKRCIEEKHRQFVDQNIIANVKGRFNLIGGEFISLYLRFWYEIRKYGHLSRKLVIGQVTMTPFHEKTDKFIRSLHFDLHAQPTLGRYIFHDHSEDQDTVVAQIKGRFNFLNNILNNGNYAVTANKNYLSECLDICELISEPGIYTVICITVRNRDNPRELMQIELYFEPKLQLMADVNAIIKRYVQQADEAKISIEDLEVIRTELTDLSTLLNKIGSININQLLSKLDLVERWKVSAIQHIVAEDKTETEDDAAERNFKSAEWISLYEKGDVDGSIKTISNKLEESPKRQQEARLYNDLGYIYYATKNEDKTVKSRKYLQRAWDLHFGSLQLTLLNLVVIDIDEELYDEAIRKIEDALLITYGRQETDVSYLRLRLAEYTSKMGYVNKSEQRPANVLETAYINLAYIYFKSGKSQMAIDLLEKEALGLMPSAVNIKRALARMYLSRNRADLAKPIYEFLYTAKGVDEMTHSECCRFLKRPLR